LLSLFCFGPTVSYLIIYKKPTKQNSREGTAKSSRDVYWAKLHSNWRSPVGTPCLSPTVVAGLRVRYSRHRSSPDTFFFFLENLFVMRGVREPMFHCIWYNVWLRGLCAGLWWFRVLCFVWYARYEHWMVITTKCIFKVR
jgi:hypothetical protein